MPGKKELAVMSPHTFGNVVVVLCRLCLGVYLHAFPELFVRMYQILCRGSKSPSLFVDGVVLVNSSAPGGQALLILLIQTCQRPLGSNMGTSFAH